MIKFYYNTGPNPAKVALFLEEAGLPYDPEPVDTRKGEQFAPSFLAINPNAKAPALVDGEAVVFDSTAILLYLAEKTGQFLPAPTPAARAALYSWLMFTASGVGPYSGQAVHFRHFAPQPEAYADNRFMYEAERHWGIVEARLAEGPWMLGEAYTIVDMAVWGWARALPFIFGPEAWDRHPHLKRLMDAIGARPAAARVAELWARHAFKTELDEEARRHMFPHNERLKSA